MNKDEGGLKTAKKLLATQSKLEIEVLWRRFLKREKLKICLYGSE